MLTVDKANRPEFPCLTCGKIFYRKLSQEKHMQHCGLNSLQQSTSATSFVCPTCGKTFAKKSQLIAHSFVHRNSDDRPFACPLCEKRFIYKHKLNQHMQSHDAKFACSICDFRATTQRQLDTHLTYHNPEYSHPCDKCETKYRNEGTVCRW